MKTGLIYSKRAIHIVTLEKEDRGYELRIFEQSHAIGKRPLPEYQVGFESAADEISALKLFNTIVKSIQSPDVDRGRYRA